MDEKKPVRRSVRFDDQGRIITLTDEERKAQVKAIHAAFAAMRAIPDDPSEVSMEEVFRAIDSHPPHRPLLEEYY